jgi:hypothetical protein
LNTILVLVIVTAVGGTVLVGRYANQFPKVNTEQTDVEPS